MDFHVNDLLISVHGYQELLSLSSLLSWPRLVRKRHKTKKGRQKLIPYFSCVEFFSKKSSSAITFLFCIRFMRGAPYINCWPLMTGAVHVTSLHQNFGIKISADTRIDNWTLAPHLLSSYHKSINSYYYTITSYYLQREWDLLLTMKVSVGYVSFVEPLAGETREPCTGTCDRRPLRIWYWEQQDSRLVRLLQHHTSHVNSSKQDSQNTYRNTDITD